jgi:hypothetical protein
MSKEATPMFFVAVPDAFPRTYELTATPPPKGDRFEALSTEVVVHSKMHGSHEKPQPYVLRGVARHGRLLVQTIVGSEYDPVGRWHEIDGEYTVEGYRFKRYALKPVLTLLKLATTAAKAAARAEKKQAQQADRDEKCGSCPVCFGDYVVTTKTVRGLGFGGREQCAMVHHGYERPGVGYIVGDCHGVGFEPFEVSCEGTKSWLTVLKNRHVFVKNLLAKVDELESTSVVTGTKYTGYGRRRVALPEYKTIKRGEVGFDRAIEALRERYVREIESLKRDIVTYTKHVAEWQPKPFPRPQAK